MPMALAAGSSFPPLSWPATHGGELDLNAMSGWRVLVVYRGAHCPLCRKYLRRLEEMISDFADIGVGVAAVSADPVDRAIKEVGEEKWTFPVGAELTPGQMRTLGLYISKPRSPEETDRDFSEPGLFVVNPDDVLQIIDISNAPFVRPDLGDLFRGLKFIRDKDYPIRGTG